MLRNYLLVALRNLRNNRLVSLINISSIALGIGACLLIGHYLHFELSYDRFHQDADQIYRVTWFSDNPQTRTPHPLAQAMATDFPEVASAVSLTPLWKGGLTRRTFSIQRPGKDVRYTEKNVLAVDSTFFDVFDFKLLQGNSKKALARPGGIILTQSTAQRYFGDENPMGQFLQVNEESALVEVVAVMEDVPDNAHFHFDFLLSYVTLKTLDPDDAFFLWEDFGHYNYLKLTNQAEAQTLEAKIPAWIIRNQFIEASESTVQLLQSGQIGFRLQPITDIHLYSHLRWELEPNGHISYVYLLSTAALFILLIAYINFINLSTARSLERTKEIGIRKALGALRYHLSVQFLCEALLVSFLGMLVALVILQWLVPYFNQVTEHQFNLSDLVAFPSLLVLVLAVLVGGVLSGLYPALYLSSFKPIAILRGRFRSSPKSGWTHKGLVVLQFGIATALIIGSIVIFNQLTYLSQKNLGFDQEAVLVVPLNNETLRGRVNTLASELTQLEAVVAATAASNLPGQSFNQHSLWRADDEQHWTDASECYVAMDFFSVLDIPFQTGRSFSRQYATDSTQGFVINESLAQVLNLTDPVGQELVWAQDDVQLRGTVIGVVKNFHYRTLHEPIRPMIFQLAPQEANYVLIKLQPTEAVEATLAAVQQVWEGFDKQFSFDFYFLDDSLQANYQAELQMSRIFGTFSLVTIIIACIGLFGLVQHATARRTKEVGIRKVLGASTSQVVALLSQDFTRLLLLALVVAIPVAGWIIQWWLQNFAYQIELTVWIFALAAGIVLLLAGATVIIQTLQTATDNPIKSLRSE